MKALYLLSRINTEVFLLKRFGNNLGPQKLKKNKTRKKKLEKPYNSLRFPQTCQRILVLQGK